MNNLKLIKQSSWDRRGVIPYQFGLVNLSVLLLLAIPKQQVNKFNILNSD